MEKKMKSTIKLFKAVPIKSKGKKNAAEDLLERTVRKGFVFSPEVIFNYTERELINFIEMITTEVGLTPEQMNASFHKSWLKVSEASIEHLFMEQIIHYITTYGFEAMGIYDEDSVYIPNERLDLPDIDTEKIRLVVIRGYTKQELKEKLLDLLKTGIALHKDTITDIIDVALFVNLDEEEIENIKNKEIRAALYDYLNLFPKNPAEFLRHIVYRSIGKTLLIKNSATIEEIKSKDNLGILNLFNRYEAKFGLERLAEVFYRFKPIFLAFKVNHQLNHIINRIRKLAKKHHKAMKIDYLNEITAEIKRGSEIDLERLKLELNRVNIFRKIRLAYALKFRSKDVSAILYRIRNGKAYAKDFQFSEKIVAERILNFVLDSIIDDISKNVRGKKIYIPEYVTYTLPATEKQFTGDLPSGTSISVPQNMLFGIYWKDVNNIFQHHRIDLDLSVISPTTGKIGWDVSYRTQERDILFSGDITAAPNGASELFYVKNLNPHELILFVNYYNFDKEISVPFKIMVAIEQVEEFGSNYMVDPNNIVAVAKTKIDQQQKVLGLMISTEEGCKFYFAETNLGRSISSYGSSPVIENSRKYLLDFYTNTISLNDILKRAGARIVDDTKDCDVDLSLENLEKDKIIGLLRS